MKKAMTIMAMLIVMMSIDSFVFAKDIPYTQEDRDRLIRFETKVKKIEDDVAENGSKLRDLLEALKSLSKTDEKVADVLKKFNLL